MNKVFIFFYSIFIFISASAKTEMKIKESVEVGTALSFHLEDLVTIKNQNAEIIRSLIDMEIPFQGNVISNEEMLKWLKVASQERPDLKQISFKIPQQIQIKKLSGLVKSQISQRIQNRLSVKCSDCVFQVQISNMPLVNSKFILLDWKDIPFSGAFMLPVTSADGHNLSWISGQIKAQRKVVKALRVVKSGETLQEPDLMIDYSDITFAKDYYLNKSDLIGKKTSRLITFGSLLTSNEIQRDYDVRQGQTVKTVTGNETYEITLQTVAQESGVSGDTIRVRNLVNQKIISARIMDKGMVRIE